MKIYKQITLILILVLASCAQPKPSFKQENISLLPKPMNFQLNESSFQFEPDTGSVFKMKANKKQ